MMDLASGCSSLQSDRDLTSSLTSNSGTQPLPESGFRKQTR